MPARAPRSASAAPACIACRFIAGARARRPRSTNVAPTKAGMSVIGLRVTLPV
ncbi:MAG: hypothetical protein MUF40_06275 [Gemmatimonadaceae bacterium]|nr:hypothetical protein [Gemmatimonadaceae bacterium]